MTRDVSVYLSGPTLYRAGIITAMLRTVGNVPWAVEWPSDAAVADAARRTVGTITAVPFPDTITRGIPRYLSTGPTGGIWSVSDPDRGDVVTLRVTGTFESFIPVDRIVAIHIGDGES